MYVCAVFRPARRKTAHKEKKSTALPKAEMPTASLSCHLHDLRGGGSGEASPPPKSPLRPVTATHVAVTGLKMKILWRGCHPSKPPRDAHSSSRFRITPSARLCARLYSSRRRHERLPAQGDLVILKPSTHQWTAK